MLASRRILFEQAPAWVLRSANGKPATLDFDFDHGRYFQRGIGAHTSYGGLTGSRYITTSRSSTGYIDNLAGRWTSVPANVARISDKGLLVEGTRTNDALWCRDMTNAVWVPVNMTAALTATGIDGVANSASTLTATAGNATILQTITLGSSADTYSVWLRRVSGSGTVNITENGGTAWTAASITTTWARFEITATLANPVFGIQIVTSGDVIEADFNQLEPGSFATSPILTTTVTATRALDTNSTTIIPPFNDQYSVFLSGAPSSPISAAQQNLFQMDDGTNNNRATIFRVSGTGVTSGFNASGGVGTTLSTLAVWAQNTAGKSVMAVSANVQKAGFTTATFVATGAGALPVGPITRINFLTPGGNSPNIYTTRIAIFTDRLSVSDVTNLVIR